MLRGMAPPTSGARWNPFRPVEMLASLWSPTAARPVGVGPAAGYRALFETLRRLVVGRRLSVAVGRGDVNVTLTVTEFNAELDMRSLSVGQLNDVRIEAEQITWNDHTLDHASVTLCNAHLRPSNPPVLVAAPVEVSLELPVPVINGLIRKSAPWVVGDVVTDDIAELRFARSPSAAGLEVLPRIDGSTVWLKPRALAVRARRLRRPPAYPVKLPDLPLGLRLTEVQLVSQVVRVSGLLPEWRMEVPRSRLERMISQLNAVGRQPMLNWWDRTR